MADVRSRIESGVTGRDLGGSGLQYGQFNSPALSPVANRRELEFAPALATPAQGAHTAYINGVLCHLTAIPDPYQKGL